MKEIARMSISFENVETVHIAGSDVNFLLTEGLSTGRLLTDNRLNEFTRAKSVSFILKPEANVKLSGDYATDGVYSSTDVFTRIQEWNDITSITMLYTDGSEESVEVEWEGTDEINNLQHSAYADGEMRVIISRNTDRVNEFLSQGRQKTVSAKRKDYISWDEYFMGLAILSAQRSKDNSTQVGACIVDDDHKIVSVGYNGMPIGCDDDEMPWERANDDPLKTKYPYVCHAEFNAILNNPGKNLKGTTIYVTLYPCNECAKAIIQSGIKKVVYLDNKYADTDATKAAAKLFALSGVKTEEYKPFGRKISIEV